MFILLQCLKPSDLRDKKIATLPGTNSDYFTSVFLNANGLSLQDVQIVSMSPPEMVVALVRGDVDAFFAWEIISISGYFNTNLFPPPTSLWKAFLESIASGEFTADVSASLRRVFIGFIIGSVLGVFLGFISAQTKKIEKEIENTLPRPRVYEMTLEKDYIKLKNKIINILKE